MEHIAVVGAGIIGVATSRELLSRGYQVTLVDPEPLSGATRAAAGMLAPVAEVTYDQHELYPLMATSARMYPEFVAGLDAGYRQTETLVIAGDAADREFLQKLSVFQAEIGFMAEPMTTRQARALEPSLGAGIAGAVRIPTDHQVDPRRLGAALLRQISGMPNFRLVKDRATSNDHPTVELEGGEAIQADKILIATASGSLASNFVPVRPVYGDVVRLQSHRHIVERTIRGVVMGRPVYVVPREDGEIVLGATTREDAVTGVTAEGVFHLLRDAQRIVPSILECEITELIARPRPGSPDDIPIIGEVSPGVHVATGFSRHGILLCPLGAQMAADSIDGRPISESVSPRRFKEHHVQR